MFKDEDIFAATANVLAKGGHEHLTLSAIAGEVGCSAPALIQRFGSKQALLKQFMEWSNSRVIERFEQALIDNRSPLAALRARLSMPPDHWLDEDRVPGGYANILAFYLEAWSDPGLRPIVEQRREILENAFYDLLVRSREAGELADCDERVLAEMLLMAFTGVALQRIGQDDSVAEERMGHFFEALIGPCRL
jgi:AcrR family transcriptional regulator